jgi:hypothetical protein
MTLGSRLNLIGRRGGTKLAASQSDYPRQPRQIIGSPTGQLNPLTMAVDGVLCDALRVSRGSVSSTIF